MPKGTNTIFFVPRSKVPNDLKVSYVKPVATIFPNKTEVNRVRLTAGGDKLEYPGVTSTDTTSLTTAKVHINSVISTDKARYLTADISDFYYGTPLSRYEYLRARLDSIPDEIRRQYNLDSIAHDGWVYIEVRKGMPGLKQAGKVANDRLKNHLAKYGYKPVPRTPALWTHETYDTTFTLCVDDFGIKYTSKDKALHLLNALKDLYKITIDWKGELYIGLSIQWNYAAKRVTISMPKYIRRVLLRFMHALPTRKQHSPTKWNQPIYGRTQQFAENESDSPKLPPKGVLHIQQVVGSLLYYALAVDCTLLVALGDLASVQTQATEETLDKTIWLLNYAATHPDASVTYVASDMCLHTHSDASYLSVPKGRSRAGGHFFLSDNPEKGIHPSKCHINGPIHVISKILKFVMGSAAEAEIGASYMNAQESLPIRVCLEEMGHPQPPTPIQVDNTTAVGFANKTIKQKRSKAIDMRFYWIQDRCN